MRQIYINKPPIGTRGYLVSNLKEGQGRVEVWGLPQRALGYEVFLFEIDVRSYVGLLFKESNPNKGLNDPAPPFDQIAPLVKQWYSLGTLEVNETGRGTLVYDKGVD